MSSDRSILDARLAEIDRRLRTIQSGLAPAAGPEPELAVPPLAVPEPPAPEPPTTTAPEPPEPPPGAPEAEPAAPGDEPPGLEPSLRIARELTDELRSLRDEHAQVLAAARSLLSQLAEQLGRDPSGLGARGAEDAAADPPVTVSLAAGPFDDAAALRRLAESIRDLPEVAGVEVREFVGRDHAVLDVTVTPPSQ